MISIKDLAKQKVHFDFYRDGHLYYRTDSGFEFAVPIEDVKGATMLNEDKAIYFVRWMRKHMDQVKSWKRA